MIEPLKLGNVVFPINIIQGPLAGYSCAPFRLLASRYSQPAFTCTEMISSKALINQPKHSLGRYVKKAVDEGPVCFQLSGNNPKELAQAAKLVTDYGANLIDLNCGCPVKKIRRKGLGSSLLTHSAHLYQLITALKGSTSVPVSIKIRVEGNSDEKCNREIAKVVTEAGADFLIVHGRHWTENYDTPCRYNEIGFFVDELKIPVIGNGDIACATSLKKMFETKCAGVMISRAGVGQPWLIKKLIADLTNQKFVPPSFAEIGLIYLEHVEGLSKLLGNTKFAMVQGRKLVKYYARGLKNKVELINAVNHCHDLSDLEKICSNYFQ